MIEKDFLEYLKDNPEKYWFKAKWYGWGWTPATKEGWLVLAVTILIVISNVYFLKLKTSHTGEVKESDYFIFGTILLVTMAALLAVCFVKGERPSWNWGDPRKKKVKG